MRRLVAILLDTSAHLAPFGARYFDGKKGFEIARGKLFARIDDADKGRWTRPRPLGIAGKQSQNVRVFRPSSTQLQFASLAIRVLDLSGWAAMRLNSETFGRRLAQIRKHRHLTQLQLGVAVGKSKRTITDWENSLCVEIWLGDVAQCARALRCQVKDLLVPVDETIPPYPLLWPRTKRRLATSAARSTLPAIE